MNFAVENLAYRHETWVNDRRYSFAQWTDGHSSFAVDGDTSAAHPKSCAILDNYFVDQPVWMVDLGRSTRVRGLVVLTWQARGTQHHGMPKSVIVQKTRSPKAGSYRNIQSYNLEI